MLKIAIIIFRECLEIAILLGVILASTRHIKSSRIYVISGAMLGTAIASLMAFVVRDMTVSYGMYGDELFDSGVILLTTVVISWTVVWMQGYTTRIRNDLGELADKISAGSTSQLALVAVVAFTVLREGIEIILFIYSISSTQQISPTEYLLGLGIGSISGFAVGLVLYFGFIKLAGKYIFRVSTILLILIAAGLASEAAGILTSTGMIELYNDPLWDTSWIADNNSILGKVLHIIIGYDSRPNGMQLIFYFTTVVLTITMMKIRTILIHRKSYA